MEIVVFSNFSKKHNSTLLPNGGTSISVRLKEDTSIENPSFILSSNDFSINYVRAFNKYYYVTNIVSIGQGRIEIQCDLDVLATYRSNILSYTAFVERSASNYDDRINDDLISSAQEFDRFSTITYPLDKDNGYYSQEGCYFVRIANRAGTANRGFTTYVATESELSSMISAALDKENYGAWLEDMLLSVFNPMEYFVSVKWFPINRQHLVNLGNLVGVNKVNYGWFDANINTYALATNVYGCRIDSSEMNFQSRVYGDWRDYNSNFTDTSIYIPGIGVQTLDPIYLKDNIKCSLNIDFLTGEGTYFLYTVHNGNNFYVSTFDCKVGIDIQLSQLITNANGIISETASAIGNMAAGNIYGTATSAVGAVSNVFKRMPSIKGSVSNILQFAFLGEYVLTRRSCGTGQYPTTVAGRPLMRNVQLSTLSGYCKCGNASLSIPGYESEISKVNDYLNSGFYIE